MDTRDNSPNDLPTDLSGAEKEVWVKPEIVDFKPITVARGISYRIGDGISNLS